MLTQMAGQKQASDALQHHNGDRCTIQRMHGKSGCDPGADNSAPNWLSPGLQPWRHYQDWENITHTHITPFSWQQGEASHETQLVLHAFQRPHELCCGWSLGWVMLYTAGNQLVELHWAIIWYPEQTVVGIGQNALGLWMSLIVTQVMALDVTPKTGRCVSCGSPK